MADPQALYQALILEHNRNPRNSALPEPRHIERVGHNPLCGDRLEIGARLADDVVEAIGCVTRGCALSVASGSMMTELCLGKSVDEIRALAQGLDDLMHGPDVTTDVGPDVDCDVGHDVDCDVGRARLGPLEAFAGVVDFPSRRRCVSLAWSTLLDALR